MVFRYVGMHCAVMQVFRYAGRQVCRCAGMQVCRYAGFAGMQVYRYAGMQVNIMHNAKNCTYFNRIIALLLTQFCLYNYCTLT